MVPTQSEGVEGQGLAPSTPPLQGGVTKGQNFPPPEGRDEEATCAFSLRKQLVAEMLSLLHATFLRVSETAWRVKAQVARREL